jgi:hypothetical protein
MLSSICVAVITAASHYTHAPERRVSARTIHNTTPRHTWLARPVALANHQLLRRRDVLDRYLAAEIAARHLTRRRITHEQKNAHTHNHNNVDTRTDDDDQNDAKCYHDAITDSENLVKVVKTFLVLCCDKGQSRHTPTSP